jgi:hypothetical protein
MLKILRLLGLRQDYVILGGKSHKLRPMGVEAAMEFTLVVLPHIAVIDAYLPGFHSAMATYPKDRPALLKSLFFALSGEMQKAPGDITKGLALLFGLDESYLAKNVTPQEVMEALPIADRLNGFQALYEAAKVLNLLGGSPS